MNLDFFKLKYQRENGLNLGFLLWCAICVHFKNDKFDRQFAYLLHASRIKDYRELKKKYRDLNNDYLLQELFFYSRNERDFKLKHLREITGFKSKEAFTDRFGEYLYHLGLDKRRAFNLEETYEILKLWNPELKGDFMKAYLKKELADKYTNGSYEKLAEIIFDNGIATKKEYKGDLVSPRISNALDQLLNDNIGDELNSPEILILYLYLFNRMTDFRKADL